METPQYNDHDLRYVCVRLCVCVICVTVAVLGAFKCVLLVSLPCFFFFFCTSHFVRVFCVNRLLIVLRYLTLDSWTPIDL